MAYTTEPQKTIRSPFNNPGVKCVALFSSYGADLDKGKGFILGSHYAENILNKVPGMGLTILRPGYFIIT